MTLLIDKKSLDNWKKFELKYERKLFYGYDGPEDGFHQWLDSKLKEFQGGNFERSIPFKNSSEVSQGAGHTALLSEQKGSDILQDKTMFIPCWPAKGIDILRQTGLEGRSN